MFQRPPRRFPITAEEANRINAADAKARCRGMVVSSSVCDPSAILEYLSPPEVRNNLPRGVSLGAPPSPAFRYRANQHAHRALASSGHPGVTEWRSPRPSPALNHPVVLGDGAGER